MQVQSTHDPNRISLLAAGGALVLGVGLVAFALGRLALDPAAWLGGSGWTLFIIVPGLVLLGLAIVVRTEATLGLTIAGSIVTTVGLLLLYQTRMPLRELGLRLTLIPGAVGVALVAHGLRVGRREKVSLGTRMVAHSPRCSWSVPGISRRSSGRTGRLRPRRQLADRPDRVRRTPAHRRAGSPPAGDGAAELTATGREPIGTSSDVRLWATRTNPTTRRTDGGTDGGRRLLHGGDGPSRSAGSR